MASSLSFQIIFIVFKCIFLLHIFAVYLLISHFVVHFSVHFIFVCLNAFYVLPFGVA